MPRHRNRPRAPARSPPRFPQRNLRLCRLRRQPPPRACSRARVHRPNLQSALALNPPRVLAHFPLLPLAPSRAHSLVGPPAASRAVSPVEFLLRGHRRGLPLSPLACRRLSPARFRLRSHLARRLRSPARFQRPGLPGDLVHNPAAGRRCNRRLSPQQCRVGNRAVVRVRSHPGYRPRGPAEGRQISQQISPALLQVRYRVVNRRPSRQCCRRRSPLRCRPFNRQRSLPFSLPRGQRGSRAGVLHYNPAVGQQHRLPPNHLRGPAVSPPRFRLCSLVGILRRSRLRCRPASRLYSRL
jgi:hypothetical protein